MQVGSVIRRRVTNRGGTREERGRLKTQDYTRLRDSINGMYKASRAREAQLIDLFLADTLDVDDFLRLKNRMSMEKRWSICRRYSTSMNLPIASYTCALFPLTTLQMQLYKLYY